MRSRKLAIGFGLLHAVAAPLPAFAQPGAAYPLPCTPSSVAPAKSEEAHAFYSAGRALYDEGNYDAAIVQFREAYKRDCAKHDLLIIISRSYELKGDRPDAVRALEVFLERVKDSPDAATHRTKIENLKKQIAAQPPAPAPAEVREHTIPPWIVVGIGGAAIVAGVIVLVLAPKLPPGCSEAGQSCDLLDENGKKIDPKGDQIDQLARNQNQAETAVDRGRAGLVTLVAGVGVVGGGLLWHFLEPTGPVSSSGSVKPKLNPAVAPGYAGLSLGGTF